MTLLLLQRGFTYIQVKGCKLRSVSFGGIATP
jgi:hypothetical protein